MAFEAFNVVPTGAEGETKLKVNKNAFAVEGELGDAVDKALDEVQKRLDFMQKKMKKDLNTAELKIANLAIEEELESSIPPSFRDAYDQEESWSEAARLIAGNILVNVNHYIGEVVNDDLTGTGKLMGADASRLRRVIDVVDAESWTDDVSKEEAGDIYVALKESVPHPKGVSTEPTPEAVVAFMDRYSPPSLLEEGARAIARGEEEQ